MKLRNELKLIHYATIKTKVDEIRSSKYAFARGEGKGGRGGDINHKRDAHRNRSARGVRAPVSLALTPSMRLHGLDYDL